MKIGEFFRNREYRLIKAKISKKRRIFQLRSLNTLMILFDGISKYRVRFPYSHPKIRTLTYHLKYAIQKLT